MSLALFALILFSVALSAGAQIVLKLGMSSPAVQAALNGGTRMEALASIASSWGVVVGLAMYGLGAMVWLLVLARIDVSKAYPFVGLGFLMTMALGYFLLAEPVTATRLLGTVLVAAGVYLVAAG
jgi:multidrug transporter EmrE-like cation transporter